jgi:hypothetical protein
MVATGGLGGWREDGKMLVEGHRIMARQEEFSKDV